MVDRSLEPMDLEALVTWAIRDQKADRTDVALFDLEAAADVDHDGWEPRGSSRDGVAEMLRRGEMGGCRVDGGGVLRGVQPRMHPDAETVADAIGRLRSLRQRGLVLLHARAGERPEWSAGGQALVPVPVPETQRGAVRHRIAGAWEDVPTHAEFARLRQRRGLPIVDRYGRSLVRTPEPGQTFRTLDDGSRQAFVKHCPVEPWPSDAWIANTNALYAAWHAGMMALLGELLGIPLRDHRLTGFNAPAAPWR